jgi:MFS family permease
MNGDDGASNHPSTRTGTTASFSLIVARIFYGVNWFNVSAVFPLIALDLNQDLSLLGSISAAFFIGVGLFQIPAGIFASKYSPRTAAILGIAVSSTAAILSGFATNPAHLIILRFVVGLGMAFFFSSGMILIARYAKQKSPGFSIGIMNSAHSVGGIVGIFAWIVIAQVLGWRPSLILSGGIGLATALLMMLTIPKSGTITDSNNSHLLQHEHVGPDRLISSPPNVLKTLTNSDLISIGLVLTGIQGAWALALTFIVVYLQDLGIPLEIIGVIASLPLISAIVSAPLIGRIYDRIIRDARTILLICGTGMSATMIGLASTSVPVIIASVIVIGIFSGGAFTVAYARARAVSIKEITKKAEGFDDIQKESKNHDQRSSGDKPPDSPDYGTLNVAWVNGLSLLGVLWMPIAFSFVVKNAGGFQTAWILASLLTALFVTIPLYKVGK